ncbi:unnamed protein product [Brassica rapa]|uniref:Secreted protein n=2 Tax=Brassica TaxID=3705 RepID=A0A8D9GXX9_BRACM|nr:unnamed protein product [Brassica napus]CAG7889184.1 unnamed protein product [Brassica rapa]
MASVLLLFLVFVFDLTAFGLAVAAEQRRTTVVGQLQTISCSDLCRVFFFIAEVCLLAGSVRNAYHTKYHVYFGNTAPSSRSLRKSVFGDWSCVHKQGLPPSFTTCA